MNLPIKRLREDAILPTYGSAYAAGADLYVPREAGIITVPPHATVMIPLGLALAIPEGYVGLMYARSSLGSKRGLAPANKVGVIDADYRGECMVALHNHTDQSASVEGGERIAQLVIAPCLHVDFEETRELNATVRGTGGFGSTGTH